MQRFAVAERGLLPYVILSQTVPLIALAPLMAGWGGRLHLGCYLAALDVGGGDRGVPGVLPGRGGHAARAAVAAGARGGADAQLRGGWWQTLLRLRLPASTPYLFPALRLAGAAAVVGAVVGEISTGTRGGIGRLVIEYSREATTDPAKVYTAMLGAALLGLAVAGVVALLELALTRHQPAGGRA